MDSITNLETSDAERALAYAKGQKSLAYARGLSELGNAFRYVSLALAVLSVRNSTRDLIIAETLETIGLIAAGLVTPFFIDRVDRIKSLLIADMLALVVSLLLIFGAYFQSLPLLFVGSFLIMAVATFYNAALRAATADLSGNSHDSILAGFSLIQLCNMAGALLGSLLAAKFLLYLSLPVLLGLDAVSFIISSLWIFAILKRLQVYGIKFSVPAVERREGFGGYLSHKMDQWRAGFREVAHRHRTRALCIAQGFVGVAYGIYTPIIVSHYKKNLHFADSLVALSQANNRLWALSGAILRMRKIYSSRLTLLASALILSIGYGFAFLFDSIWIFAVIGFANFGMALGGPTNNAAISASVAPEFRGRVEAFRNLTIDLGVLAGNLIALVVGGFFNIRYLFPIAGLMTLVTFAIYAYLNDWPDTAPKPAKPAV